MRRKEEREGGRRLGGGKKGREKVMKVNIIDFVFLDMKTIRKLFKNV